MTQALRESEDALIRLCKQALRRRSQSGYTKPPAYVLSHVQFPSHSPSETFQSLSEERLAPSRALLDMYKNQLQELAQRSCFNLPSYGCLREGPDHAPRFKATVKFNNEVFEGPGFCSTLRQAEHAVAEVALQELSKRGPTQSLAAKMLDETGVCKNLLQETAQKAGVPLPLYTSNRTGPGHLPVYICTVNVGGRKYVGQSAKTKKQAEKNAAAAAWAALKKSQNVADSESDEQAQTAVVKALLTAPPEGDSELPSTSEGPLFHEQISLPREPLRTSRLFGGVTSTGPSWQGAEYGLHPKPSEGAKAEVAVGAERAVGSADVAEGSGGADRVGMPPPAVPFNLFGAAPPIREREWISPAEARQARPVSPQALAAPVVVRTLQVKCRARPDDDDTSNHAEPDDDDSDYESPTGKVLGGLKKGGSFE